MRFECINQFFDHIYVITLERDIDRQEHIEKHLDGVDYTFFFGVDKKNLVMDDLINNGEYNENKAIEHQRFGKPMNTGQIGISWSHRLVYEDMLAKGFKKVLILEDEVIPGREGFDLLQEAFDQLPKDWELLYLDCDKNLGRNLGTWFKQIGYHIRRIFGRMKWSHQVINNLYARKYSTHLLKAGMHDCTNAYAITASAAKKLIALQTPISFLSDGLLSHACTHNIVNGFVLVSTVFQKHTGLRVKTLID